jgi:cyclophilin family peptidyl-prolyl cis-trans isomerase
MPPKSIEGTEAPSHIEYLYERYRPLLKWLLVLLVLGIGGYELYKRMAQATQDGRWSSFVATVGMDGAYVGDDLNKSLTDYLAGKELAKVEEAARSADAAQRPFLLLALARRAMLDRNWERAESALAELEQSFPQHALVASNPYPIQVRDVVKEKEEETAPKSRKQPELKPQEPGSIVSRMRAQIARAKAYVEPGQFAKVAIPENAPKVKIEFSEGYGSITIALMVEQAPLHCAKFLELAKACSWKDLNVDEIQRSPSSSRGWKNPMQFHLGFATTKEADRSKWIKTDPSTNQVEYEDSGLSHFPGAVAARLEADGKSCADRFYVCYEDCAMQDGSRPVFGYVVEGLENVKQICEASLNAQEAEAGRGTPEANITVVNVTVLE